MSSDDDFDVFNDFVRNNKIKLKDKYISKCEFDVLNKALDSFIVSSDNENSELESDNQDSQIFSSSENDSSASYKSNKKNKANQKMPIYNILNETSKGGNNSNENMTNASGNITSDSESIEEKNDKATDITQNPKSFNNTWNESSELFSDNDLSDTSLTSIDDVIDLTRNGVLYKPDLKTDSFESIQENDKKTNITSKFNSPDQKILNDSSEIFSDDDPNDTSLASNDDDDDDDDIDLTRNTVPSKTYANSFKTPNVVKLDVHNTLQLFKTPKIPKSNNISGQMKKSNICQENTTSRILQSEVKKSLCDDDLSNEQPVKKIETEVNVTPAKKKINLQSLIKTCEPKNKPLHKKFSRLIVESDEDEEEKEEDGSSEEDLSDFINDSDVSVDKTESELSDLDFSEDSTDSDSDDRKKFMTPKQKPIKQLPYTMPTKSHVEKNDFISSLLNDIDDGKRDSEAIMFRLKFNSKKEELAQKIYKIYNEKAFMNLLPQDIQINWNATLRKTAGKCYCKKNRKTNEHSIYIVLSKKVITDTDRLLKTLVHELCHGACWMINKVNAHHGPIWKEWTVKAHRAFPVVPLSSRCHNYKIHYKFHYVCHKCSIVSKRHSKSLDTNLYVCSKCKGEFTLYRVASNGTKVLVKDSEKLNKFSIFVKEKYKEYRKPGITHAETMKKLSELYKSLNETPKDELSSLLESIQLTDKSEK